MILFRHGRGIRRRTETGQCENAGRDSVHRRRTDRTDPVLRRDRILSGGISGDCRIVSGNRAVGQKSRTVRRHRRPERAAAKDREVLTMKNLQFEYGHGLMNASLPDNTDVFIPGVTVPDPPYIPAEDYTAL